MTASDKLRQLVNKATPGPWTTIDARIGDRTWVQVGPVGNLTVTADVANLADAHLIALAPQLAELVADMAEELAEIRDDEEWKFPGYAESFNPLLARLDALFEKETA